MKKSYIYALISVFFWASTAPIVKLLLNNLNSLQILMFSTSFATIILFIIITFQKKLYIVKTFRLKDYFIFMIMGFIGIFLYAFCLYSALFYLQAQEAFIINYLWPMMIIIFAIFILKEKINIRKILAMFLSFIGIVIIVTNGNIINLNFADYRGVGLAILAAVSYGLFSVLTKKLKYDKLISMMFYYLFSFILSLVFVVLFSEIPQLNGIQLVGIAWNGIFNSAIAFTTWSLALKYGNTSKISNLAFLTPFLSLVYIHIFIGEKIGIYSIIGLLIIMLGIIIQSSMIFDKLKR